MSWLGQSEQMGLRNMVDSKMLDKIIIDTVKTIEQSKTQIFDIAEMARAEYSRVDMQLLEIKGQVKAVIGQVDERERQFRMARLRLMEVSRDFKRYTEEDIKDAYQMAQVAQLDLVVLRERESHLRQQRDDLERTLRNLQATVRKAEAMVSQVSFAMEYLRGNLRELSGQLDNFEQRHLLGMRVIKAQEEERRRVARDIHDGPAQTLANVVLRAEICEKLLDSDLDAVRQELRQLKDVVRHSLKDIRQVIYDLRPMTLDDLGLIPTLRRYINEIKERPGTMIEFSVVGKETRLPNHVEVGVFRVVQEALNNIVKHADASAIWVRIEFAPEAINLLVKDNGAGFDPREAITRQGDHFGLLSMRERVELLQGTWKLDSNPGQGTKIWVQVPLKGEGI
jgi:two-component system sensor histidine kinase DegS